MNWCGDTFRTIFNFPTLTNNEMEQYIKKQLSEGYNENLNDLFRKWKDSYEADVRYLFCLDGLMVKYQDENSGYDINGIWRDAERKIMFIVKDCPDEWGHDARRLMTGYEDNAESQKNALKTRTLKGQTGFFKNIARMLYGLWYMTEDNKGKELQEQICNDATIIQAFNDIPFAYVEGKKLAGGKSCSDSELRKALERDGAFLVQEIDILRPNIIVCCDTSGIIFNHVVRKYFNGKIPDDEHKWEYRYTLEDKYCGFDCRLYYYEEEGVLLFHSYHPTRRGKAGWKIYERVLSPFRQFFAKYKSFGIVSSAAQK